MIKPITIKTIPHNVIELEAQNLIVEVDNIEILISVESDKVSVSMFRANDSHYSGTKTELTYQEKENE